MAFLHSSIFAWIWKYLLKSISYLHLTHTSGLNSYLAFATFCIEQYSLENFTLVSCDVLVCFFEAVFPDNLVGGHNGHSGMACIMAHLSCQSTLFVAAQKQTLTTLSTQSFPQSWVKCSSCNSGCLPWENFLGSIQVFHGLAFLLKAGNLWSWLCYRTCFQLTVYIAYDLWNYVNANRGFFHGSNLLFIIIIYSTKFSQTATLSSKV